MTFKDIFFSFLRDKSLAIVTYLLCLFIFMLTIILHNLAIELFIDGFLFSLVIYLVFMIVSFIAYNKKMKKLLYIKSHQIIIESSQMDDLPSASSLSEKLYQAILLSQLLDKEAMQAKNQQQYNDLMEYYGMWTHQIKTPVSSLDLMCQMEKIDTSLMKKELFKIDEYLNMMLHYLKTAAIEQDLVFAKYSLKQIVFDAIKKYATFFSQENLSLSLKIEDQKIITDKKWLTFIIDQLLFNAIKYTPKGRITISNQGGVLSIKDTGIGLLPQDVPRIFEKGYTGFNGRMDKKSTGLGLHMSQEIAKSLGITIKVTSTLDVGSSFSLEFEQRHFNVE